MAPSFRAWSLHSVIWVLSPAHFVSQLIRSRVYQILRHQGAGSCRVQHCVVIRSPQPSHAADIGLMAAVPANAV